MPRHRKPTPTPTPARGRRAIPGDKPARKRQPPAVPAEAGAEPATHPYQAPDEPRSEVASASVSSPAPVSSPILPPVAAFQHAVELRDTRPFRERVSSRRGTVGLLLFRMGSETFAAELGAVEEAIEVPALHGLPEMQTGMLGMFDLRGKLLPVFSASGVLGVPLTAGSTATLIVRGAGRRIGIAVDDVEDVIDADCTTLRNPPGGPDPDGVLLAVLQRGTALASVIDCGALVTACLASSPEHA